MKAERRLHLKRLALWTWTWVATLALATFGPKFLWDHDTVWTTATIAVNLVNGVLMIWANRKLFLHYDELERKIHLEAMAMTLGLTVIVGLTYSALVQQELVPGPEQIGFLIMFMGVTYLVSLLIARRQYL